MSDALPRLRRLARFSLVSAGLDRLTDFYLAAFDCRLEIMGDGTDGEGSARRMRLALGAEQIELLQFAHPGAPYPAALTASDLRFQHCAIVAADMDAAYAQLARTPGWQPISRAGPQRLPANTGHVTAFKFRDPEGHPLELLAFAPGHAPARWRQAARDALFLGVDHSAIGVAGTARSVAFYASLGFAVAGGSHNRGPEQARLDALAAPDVEVTALALPAGGAHLELLCYRDAARRAAATVADHDIAATRLVFQGEALTTLSFTDPDGHRLVALAAEAADQNG